MKPPTSYMTSFVDSLKKLYVTKVCQPHPLLVKSIMSLFQFKGFDVDQMAACTLLLEGTAEVHVCVYFYDAKIDSNACTNIVSCCTNNILS